MAKSGAYEPDSKENTSESPKNNDEEENNEDIEVIFRSKHYK